MLLNLLIFKQYGTPSMHEQVTRMADGNGLTLWNKLSYNLMVPGLQEMVLRHTQWLPVLIIGSNSLITGATSVPAIAGWHADHQQKEILFLVVTGLCESQSHTTSLFSSKCGTPKIIIFDINRHVPLNRACFLPLNQVQGIKSALFLCKSGKFYFSLNDSETGWFYHFPWLVILPDYVEL